MTDLCDRRPALASARMRPESDNPPIAQPPICKNERRETWSQYRDADPRNVSMRRFRIRRVGEWAGRVLEARREGKKIIADRRSRCHQEHFSVAEVVRLPPAAEPKSHDFGYGGRLYHDRMSPTELFQEARLDEAIAAQRANVESRPDDVSERLLLGELLAFTANRDEVRQCLDYIKARDVQEFVREWRQLLAADDARHKGEAPQFLIDPPDHILQRLKAA